MALVLAELAGIIFAEELHTRRDTCVSKAVVGTENQL